MNMGLLKRSNKMELDVLIYWKVIKKLGPILSLSLLSFPRFDSIPLSPFTEPHPFTQPLPLNPTPILPSCPQTCPLCLDCGTPAVWPCFSSLETPQTSPPPLPPSPSAHAGPSLGAAPAQPVWPAGQPGFLCSQVCHYPVPSQMREWPLVLAVGLRPGS